MDTQSKQALIKDYSRGAKDTGSTEVQVALITQRVNAITEHLRGHGQDHHSRRGLFSLVGQRRRLLRYLHTTDVERYRTLIQKLGLRR